MLFLGLFLLLTLEFSLANKMVVTRVHLGKLRLSNANCNGTCSGHRNDNILNFFCQCGTSCVRLGTCCKDAPAILAGEVMEGYMKGIECGKPFGYGQDVSLVQGCPPEWDGDDSVRDQCVANGHERSDLMLLVPVSSLKTGITYKNYFCFVCNTVDESDDSPISWDVGVRHQGSLHVDLGTLTYQENRWTFPGAPSDVHITLGTEPPKKLLEKHSLSCRSGEHVTSSCAADWTDEATRTECASYTSLVYMTKQTGGLSDLYRNVHCGLCNGASLDSVTCEHVEEFDIPGKGAKKPAFPPERAFQEMFRISEVPEDECPEGKLYDKVSKKCRAFRCGRNLEMAKGRCVRKK